MRTIIWFLYFILYFICLIPKLWYVKHLDKKGEKEKVQAQLDKAVAVWADRLMRLAGMKIEVEGRENLPEGPAVFVSNHQGNFDIPLLLTRLDRPHGFIAKIETLKLPLVRDWMKLLHCVFLDRKDARSAVASLNSGIRELKDGYSIIIFPEGTRSRGPEMGEFKLGAFTIAGKAKVPVVPLRIDGTYRAMEANGMWIRPAQVHLTILPPIQTHDKTKAELKVLGEEVRELIQNAAVEPVREGEENHVD